MSRTLEQWLEHWERQHPVAVDMGLDRVRAVAGRLGLKHPARQVITVAGTNGKGSTVAFIEAIARASGLRVGAYTSPHVLRYNERIRVDGADCDDASLCAAFSAIDAARHDTSLTYFEAGTLAALWLFGRAGLDLAILEVGLGGRLDATNLIDADVAVVTTVDIDHQALLGTDRETIGAEKAGILRAGKRCVLAEKDPPSSLLRRAYELGVIAIRGHCDYLLDRHGDHWCWREPGFELNLPWPALAAPAQLDNAAAAIAALRASSLVIAPEAWAAGVAAAQVSGRLQKIANVPEVIVDVAHNPQAARQLAQWLATHPRPTRAVFSVLADKDLAGIVEPVAPWIRHWHLAPITDAGPRGLPLADLIAGVAKALPQVSVTSHAGLSEALLAARAEALAGGGDADARERVLVFGSFHTVAAVLTDPFVSRRDGL